MENKALVVRIMNEQTPVEHFKDLAEKGRLKWKALLQERPLPYSVDPNKDIEFSLTYPGTETNDILKVIVRIGPTVLYEKSGDNSEYECIGRSYKKTSNGEWVPDHYRQFRYNKSIAPSAIDKNGFHILPLWGDREKVAKYLIGVLPYLTVLFREQQPFKLGDLTLPEGVSLPEDHVGASFQFPGIMFELHPSLSSSAVTDLARQSVVLHINDAARKIMPTLDEIVRNLCR